MTLGEIIKKYGEEHSISQFIKDSGLSKAYVYMLIANKNNKGEPITPSIDTIKKVASGMHKTFEDVFNQLDYDFMIRINDDPSLYNDETEDTEKNSIEALPEEYAIKYSSLDDLGKSAVHNTIDFEFMRGERMREEASHVLDNISSIDDAKQIIKEGSAAFPGQTTDSGLIHTANVIKQYQKKKK